MAIKRYKPTTPGRRGASVIDYSELTKKRPEKALSEFNKSKAGRNSQGRITVRHQGGGHKRLYRVVDFRRQKFDIEATVAAIEYDPNRTPFLALLHYKDGEKAYIIASEGLKIGDKVLSSEKKLPVVVGNAMQLQYIPTGVQVSLVEIEPGKGARLVRSAGMSATVQGTEGKYTQIKMPSGEVRLVPKTALATIGRVSNSDHRNVRLGKAGRKRHLGVRPTVRGKAMNPVDHPHGGGEGSQPIGMKGPKNIYGKKALGVKTRRPAKHSDKFILKPRKKKKK